MYVRSEENIPDAPFHEGIIYEDEIQDVNSYVARLNELLFEDLSIQEAKTTAIKLIRGLPEVIRLEVIDILKKD